MSASPQNASNEDASVAASTHNRGKASVNSSDKRAFAPGPNVARRSERARTAILTSALQLARDVGYSRMSIEGIAADAGVGKQTIYRWWPSKAAVVFDAILEQNSQDGGEVVIPDTGDVGGGSADPHPCHGY
ncbi:MULTISPECIES: TetR/AcrR family transcriptional regulator [Brevibacterium]|uniref:TetR/AcrR family transcriptional regulator n=1 Tax=Brevibacterium TaxID=1696 RepID=UPI0035941DC6